MRDEYFVHLADLDALCSIPRLQRELAEGALGAVHHCHELMSNHELYATICCVLHRDPSPRTSATRDEQLRDSDGPPPEDVPRKVTDIGMGAMMRFFLLL